MKTLHLFPDTNLFIQCHSLGELDWSVWSEFDEIQLIVCKPIQREIDNQKRRDNDRVGKRARKIHSMIHKILVEGRESELIRKESPRVRICIDPSVMPDPKMNDRLDYNQIDDQLIGCIHSFRERYPDRDVRLLTHDAGPMATAKMLELQFVPIPEDWLRPPERSRIERENQRLQNELAKIKRAEPQIESVFIDDDQIEIQSLTFERLAYQPLTQYEIAELIEKIKEAIPAATNDEHSKSTVQFFKFLVSIKKNIDEALTMSSRAISEYIDKEYPKWINRCEYVLRHLHLMLENELRPTTFSLSARNDGTRPGKDVLLSFVAEGNFKIRPPIDVNTKDNSMEKLKLKAIPSNLIPPETLKGNLALRYLLADSCLPDLAFKNSQAELFRVNEPVGFFRPEFSESPKYRFVPDSFRYTQRCSETPVEIFSLKSRQWRHGGKAEIFGGELCFDQNCHEIRGAVECSIEAENLSTPVKNKISVNGKPIVTNIRELADSIVEDLILLVDELPF